MVYRTEHPKPQFMREAWQCLNGEWQFEIDNGNSGEDKGFYKNDYALSQKINVPFCPQSELSGINYKDFMSSVWYKREITVTKEQLCGNVFLHIGACDYASTVYINGSRVGKHIGGYVSFKLLISDYLTEGKNTVCIHAEDNERDRLIPRGKQSELFYSHGCDYTRTTGIWQTVWLEFTPKEYIKSFKLFADEENQTLTAIVDACGKGTIKIATAFNGVDTGCCACHTNGEQKVLTVKLTKKHLWEIGKGGLYDVVLSFNDDTVKSYFGLRSISYRDKKFFLNGKSVFQRLVLDQGFYPDGIYTAPSDKELENDILRSMAMGFNGARLHQKVFEERFLYHADRLGYIVWGEYPNWGLDHTYPDSIYGILPEWLEEIERDFNHPSIVGWCPFNETWDVDGRRQCDFVLSTVYRATKAADFTRPCIDVSGNFHVEGCTDIYDVHDYNQNVDEFKSHYARLALDGTYTEQHSFIGARQKYGNKLPFFVSEYGGIRWSDKNGWGYGEAPTTPDEYISRLKGLTDVLLDNEAIFAFCYTQLTDIEQEQNGLYTYDRKPKFSPDTIRTILSKKAAVEE